MSSVGVLRSNNSKFNRPTPVENGLLIPRGTKGRYHMLCKIAVAIVMKSAAVGMTFADGQAPADPAPVRSWPGSLAFEMLGKEGQNDVLEAFRDPLAVAAGVDLQTMIDAVLLQRTAEFRG